jgi:inner membrane transporter RhtA
VLNDEDTGAPRRAAGRGRVPPELLVIAAAVSVQGGGAIAAQLIARHSPIVVVALRSLFSTAILLVVRPPGRPRTDSAWRLAILLGLVMAGMNALFYVALSRIPLGVAVTLEFTGPLVVAVAGSRRPRDLVWVALAAVGIYLLAGARLAADDALGVAAALGAGACWAAFIVVGARLAHAWPDGRGLSVALATGSAVLVPLAVAFGAVGALLADPAAILGGLVIAVLSSALPYTLELAALRRIAPATYGVLLSVEPAIAAAFGFVVLGQALDGADLIGIALVAIASAGASLSARALEVAPGELEAA